MSKYPIISLFIVVIIASLIVYFFKENAWPTTTTTIETNRNLDTELVTGRHVEVKYEVNGADITKVGAFNITSEGDYVIYEGVVTENGDNIKWTRASPFKKDGTSAKTPITPTTDAVSNAKFFGSGKTPPTVIPRFPTITDMKKGEIPKAVWPGGTIPTGYGISGDTCITGTMVKIGNWSCPKDAPGDGWGYLYSGQGTNVLSSPGDSSDDGKQLLLAPKRGELGQLWKFIVKATISGNSYGKICNKHGKCLTVSGTSVVQKPNASSTSWWNIDLRDGHYRRFQQMGTSKFLQTYLDSGSGNAVIDIIRSSPAASSKWRILDT